MRLDPEIILSSIESKRGYLQRAAPVSEEEIKAAESRLGVRFPAEYAQFLKRKGFISWFGHTIFGISDDEEDSVVEATEAVRAMQLPASFTKWPDRSIVIKRYGGGGYYFLLESGEVVLVLDELLGKEVETWANFWVFLEEFK